MAGAESYYKTLLEQWAVWAGDDGLGKMWYSKARWQDQFDAGYQEEGLKSVVKPGPDDEMMRVDSALRLLREEDQRHYRVIIRFYRHGVTLRRELVDHAVRSFGGAFEQRMAA